MAKEEEILVFKVEQGEAFKELEKTKRAILELKKEQQDLQKAYKSGNITIQEYSKGLVRVENNLKVLNKEYSETQKKVTGVTSSFDKLNESNRNIADSLKRLDFAGVKQGIIGATKASLAFIATPIGAVIAALGVAVGALTAYFRGSEEGQTKFNRIMNVGSAIIGKFSDLVQFLGGFLFEKLASGFETIIGFLEEWVPGFKEATNALSEFLNLDTSARISALQERQVLLNRELITQREILKEEIKAAEVRSEGTRDIQKRSAALKEARDKINELFSKEKELAKLESDILIQQAKLSNNTIEANDEIERSKARQFQLETERQSRLKELTTKETALNEQAKAQANKELAEREKRDAEESEIQRKKRERELEATYIQNENLTEAERILQQNLKAIREGGAEAQFNITQKALRESIKAGEKETKERQKQADIQKVIDASKLESLTNIFAQGAALAKDNTALSKVLGASSATVDTYKAANLALATYPPPLGGILAAVNIATGLANVTKILGLTAAAGGGSFMTKGPQLMMVGDNPGGVERVDVTPVSGVGRTSVGGGMIKMAGGGSVIANASSGKIDREIGLNTMLKDLKIYASWTEGRDVGNKIQFKESLTTI